MNKKTCDNDHRYDEVFSSLADYQGGPGRHKCAGCADERGRRRARAGLPKEDEGVLELLPNSQAAMVRHKDAYQAYCNAYDDECRLMAMLMAA